ncbi:MAG: type II secretion system protein GspG [Patescibacteria group bacterium]
MNKKGYTLIELLVVISIIGFLASFASLYLNVAREKSRLTQVKAEVNQLVKSMKLYEMDVGELPPRGDSCPSCCYPDCQAAWDSVTNAMLYNDGTDWNGPYLSMTIPQDPWGNHFYYDDNACNSNCGNSWLGSAGPDGIKGTGDDYRILVTARVDVLSCCY